MADMNLHDFPPKEKQKQVYAMNSQIRLLS
jgi:hypothetical protein